MKAHDFVHQRTQKGMKAHTEDSFRSNPLQRFGWWSWAEPEAAQQDRIIDRGKSEKNFESHSQNKTQKKNRMQLE